MSEQGPGSYQLDQSEESFKIEAQGGQHHTVSAETVHASQSSAPVGSDAGRSSGSLSLHDPSWTQDLSERLRELHQQKRQHLTLELEPKNLGRIVLRVEAEQNQISAWVSTGSEQVRSLLAQNAPVLRQHLKEQGLMLGNFFVDVGGEKANQHAHRRGPTTSKKQNGNIPKMQRVEKDGMPISKPLYQKGSGEQLISVFA